MPAVVHRHDHAHVWQPLLDPSLSVSKSWRAHGFFPIITCTQRGPDLEVQAARAMLSYQVEFIVATGATDPDRISDICKAAGIRSYNLDLPEPKHLPSCLTISAAHGP